MPLNVTNYDVTWRTYNNLCLTMSRQLSMSSENLHVKLNNYVIIIYECTVLEKLLDIIVCASLCLCPTITKCRKNKKL